MRARRGVLVGLASLLILVIPSLAAAIPLTPYAPLADDAFTSAAGTSRAPQTSPTPTVAPGQWNMQAAGRWLAAEMASQRPTPTPTASPAPPPTSRPTATPRPRATSAPQTSISATWYCNKDATRGALSRCTRGHQGGLYAAISPDLASLRGKHVTACYRSSCVVVTVIDCNCQATGSIDLYADAFVKLAPLSAGRLKGVTISW